MELKKPLCDLLEDYLFLTFQSESLKLKESDRFKVYLGRASGSFLQNITNAVMNIYVSKIMKVEGKSSLLGYSHDSVNFFIDVFVSPTFSKSKIWFRENMTQDEAAHKALLVYTNIARDILCDLKNRNFGLEVGVITNFRLSSIESFDVEYSETERSFQAARLDFTLDMPYMPSDEQDYHSIKSIFVSLGNELSLQIGENDVSTI